MLDLSNPNEMIQKTRQLLDQRNGKIDIVINNGGVSQRSTFMNTDFENDITITNINYLSQVAITKVLSLPLIYSHKLILKPYYMIK